MPRKPNGRGIGWRKGMKGNGTTKQVTRMTYEEQSLIFRMSEDGHSCAEIAEKLNRETSTITRFLARFRDTTLEARAVIRAKAVELAKRVVKNADVNQAMDLLSRPGIDVLQPPVDNRRTTGGLNVSVGVSSLGAMVKVEHKSVGESNVQRLPEGVVPTSQVIEAGPSQSDQKRVDAPEA